ncbi:MAG TPA: exopolysaccharide biosynthesis polyprenyl glycosylphosphotransferase [Parafilimonas sp.]|nr:exopolysaccharide biosynthesis polyprenyl glycosylphosphotransferase [Parafilimonas sp.]
MNILLAALLLMTSGPAYSTAIKVGLCLMNAGFLVIFLRNLPRFLKRNDGRLLIGRKRTLIVLLVSVYIGIIVFSSIYPMPVDELFSIYLAWSFLLSVVYLFADPISDLLHKIFKRPRRIAIVGYDDNTNKLIEKLKRKSNNQFISHLSSENIFEYSNDAELLSGYIDYAKKNHINEFYISVPENEDSSVSILAEEAEKHCIRVNFIAPQKDLESGFYHVSYIGGLPVLQRYREPLKRIHKQLLKRTFDIIISSLVIIFILSWLIPLISLLIKLESKGPVFFRQLRSGRDNDSFWCLKFRSMRTNAASDLLQATKGDDRITKVGNFLRKTSLDEFPQFLNVFMGDMSIVGPRPHMLHHTEQYSSQVNHYMARLYLKPGVTGWAQVNGYRGEIKNIELMKNRVEHDIWYMENWSILLDIKIMYLTLANIIKGEENAY